MDQTNHFFDAIRKGDSGQVRAMLAAEPKLASSANPDGATPALWALYTGHVDLANVVLEGREPDFFEACALGLTKLVGELAKGDAGLLNGYSKDGFTGLGLAVFFNHPETVSMLVAAGAEVDRASRNRLQVAPLHSAIASGNMALLELLLKHGAAPDPVEFLGATPLHSAAAHGNREMVNRLLTAGADPSRKTNDGKTPADVAAQYGHAELARELAAPTR
jgi:uncharacterized protein